MNNFPTETIDDLLILLIDSARDAVFILNDEGKTIFCNSTSEKMFGYTTQEIIGADLHKLVLSSDDYSRFKPNLDEFRKTGTGDALNRITRFSAQCKNGTVLPVEISLSAILREGRWFASGIVRDISNRVAIEMLLKKEIKLRELNEIELRDAKEAAESANRTKNLFLANMSHELRTPLNSIIGFSQLLEMQMSELDNSGRLEYLSYITKSGSHLLDIVNDLLDISKIESGNVSLEITVFSLPDLIHECINEFNADITEKNISIETDIDEKASFIKADRMKLRQIISNLLSNAVKFTNPGKKIGVSVYAEKTSAVIKIWDHGIGIPEESLNDIFKSFEQVRNDITVKNHGTGLGLAIAKKLTELHGGTILVNSEKNAGSEFTVIISGLTTDPDNHHHLIGEFMEQKPISESPGNGKYKILVVEDNLVNIKLIKTLLESSGYTVDTAETGTDGVAMATENQYAIVLMDIELPDISGIDAMKMIKDSLNKNLPVIALTAHSMQGDEEAMMAHGFDGYVGKPINLRNILDLIKKFLP